jgi:hypothetical protein
LVGRGEFEPPTNGLKIPYFKIRHGIEVAVAGEDRQPML